MIRIVEGDIAALPVTAVVRPADEHLEPMGATAARLDAQGGARLAELRRVQAPLEVGSAVITGGGSLAAEFVLHLVIQSEERTASPDTIRRALASAWHRAEAWQLNLVAASVDGLGGPHVAPETTARLLVESFRDRPGTTGVPAELQIVVRTVAERGAVTPYLPEFA